MAPLFLEESKNLTVARWSILKNTKWTIKLNGHERFAPRESGYFTGTQIANHHTGCSGIMKSESIFVYSFALKPEEHQPSGTHGTFLE